MPPRSNQCRDFPGDPGGAARLQRIESLVPEKFVNQTGRSFLLTAGMFIKATIHASPQQPQSSPQQA